MYPWCHIETLYLNEYKNAGSRWRSNWHGRRGRIILEDFISRRLQTKSVSYWKGDTKYGEFWTKYQQIPVVSTIYSQFFYHMIFLGHHLLLSTFIRFIFLNAVYSFITFRSCKHLDGKHSIFGKIVGGAETTLSAIESVETDNKDKPIEEIIIQKAQVFVDPFAEADEMVKCISLTYI